MVNKNEQLILDAASSSSEDVLLKSLGGSAELSGMAEKLARDGKIFYWKDGSGKEWIAKFDNTQLQLGKVAHSGSKVFIESEDGRSLIFDRNRFAGFIAGDTVRYLPRKAYVHGAHIGLEAAHLELVKESDVPMVCRMTRDREGMPYFVPENPNKYPNTVIHAEITDSSAMDAQLVSIKILKRTRDRWGKMKYEGSICEIFGAADSVGAQVAVSLATHGIPHDWPEKVTEQASRISDEVTAKDKLRHRDITHLPLITIDGEDARDFDDAVYCERLPDGWKLYVAIADVSYYVRSNSPLDGEALKRGNSVYYPDVVIPMLPEKLSNGLCSLNPNVDRLCMVCEMFVDRQGLLGDFEFYQGVMHSHARMTYTKVHKMLEGDEGLISEYSDIYPHVKELYSLYKVLDKARHARGAIEFESEEMKFFFDENRQIEDLAPMVRNESHKMIEEFMIMANVAAAKFIEQNEEKTVFRIHPKPSEEKLKSFRQFLAKYGLTLRGDDNPQPADYAKLIEQTSKREDANVFNLMMLRSLAKAVYSPQNCGHFGLSLKQYAHFTSPIRRYPDLMLHREIKNLLGLGSDDGARHYEMPELSSLGEHCSETERRADEATGEVTAWLKCRFMEDKLFKELDAVITNVAPFGIFVQLENWRIDGLVYIANLGQDYFFYNEDTMTLKGKNTGVCYSIGDRLKVVATDVSETERKINFQLARDYFSEDRSQQSMHKTPSKNGTKGNSERRPRVGGKNRGK